MALPKTQLQSHLVATMSPASPNPLVAPYCSPNEVSMHPNIESQFLLPPGFDSYQFSRLFPKHTLGFLPPRPVVVILPAWSAPTRVSASWNPSNPPSPLSRHLCHKSFCFCSQNLPLSLPLPVCLSFHALESPVYLIYSLMTIETQCTRTAS